MRIFASALICFAQWRSSRLCCKNGRREKPRIFSPNPCLAKSFKFRVGTDGVAFQLLRRPKRSARLDPRRVAAKQLNRNKRARRRPPKSGAIASQTRAPGGRPLSTMIMLSRRNVDKFPRNDEAEQISNNWVADGVRFELTVRCRTPHFECGAIDHSATHPQVEVSCALKRWPFSLGARNSRGQPPSQESSARPQI